MNEIPGRDVAFCRLAGRKSDAAVAHDHRGHAVPRRACNHRVPADLGVVMSVRVDKAGRDDEVGSVDRPRGTVHDFADFDNSAVCNRHVRAIAGRASPIDYSSVSDEQIVRHFSAPVRILSILWVTLRPSKSQVMGSKTDYGSDRLY